MVRAELSEKLDDIKVEMHGDARAVSTEVMYLMKMVGAQLESLSGISARTHIVNMCKLIVEDKMSMTETMHLAEKTMAGEEVPLDELATDDKITQLQEKLMDSLQKDLELRKNFPGTGSAYNAGWNNALCWVLHLTGKMIDLNEFTL